MSDIRDNNFESTNTIYTCIKIKSTIFWGFNLENQQYMDAVFDSETCINKLELVEIHINLVIFTCFLYLCHTRLLE